MNKMYRVFKLILFLVFSCKKIPKQSIKLNIPSEVKDLTHYMVSI